MVKETKEALRLLHTTHYNHPSPEIQVARLEMILEVSRVLNSTLDLNLLLQTTMKNAIQLTYTEAASILLLESQQHEFYVRIAKPELSAPIPPQQVMLSGSIADWIIKNNEPVVIDNIQHTTRYYSEVDWIPQLEIRAILGVPLVTEEKIIGTIEVMNKQGQENFTEEDIHILHTLASQAAVAIEKAHLFEQKDQLTSIFHELRSPLSMMIGSSQTMLSDPDMDVQELRLALENFHGEMTRLSQMVDDFLDLTQIESGRIHIHKERIDLKQLAQDVIEQFRPVAKKKQISISFNNECLIPYIYTDPRQIRQVIINLVDNAVRYNREGGSVKITISCNKVRVLFSVEDTGRGIAPNDLERVFDKFYRGEDKDNSSAGLGLTLAKKIIEFYEGDIWVISEPNRGTIFTFSLPLTE